MKSGLRCVVVDDEPLARKRLRLLLEEREDVAEIEECSDGREALRSIRANPPDLVFLDVQMPELDGFDVLERLGAPLPPVIFVTAFDAYALEAFRVAALDFLLKPFEDERFQAAFERAIERLEQRHAAELGERIACLMDGRRLDAGAELPAPQRPIRRLPVHRRGRIYFVPIRDVSWLEAEGAYVRVHTQDRSHLIRDSLKRLEEVLDPERFVRIHRSTLVNVERIAELSPLFHGEYHVTLEDGTELKLSRGYRENLPRLLEG